MENGCFYLLERFVCIASGLVRFPFCQQSFLNAIDTCVYVLCSALCLDICVLKQGSCFKTYVRNQNQKNKKKNKKNKKKQRFPHYSEVCTSVKIFVFFVFFGFSVPILCASVRSHLRCEISIWRVPVQPHASTRNTGIQSTVREPFVQLGCMSPKSASSCLCCLPAMHVSRATVPCLPGSGLLALVSSSGSIQAQTAIACLHVARGRPRSRSG